MANPATERIRMVDRQVRARGVRQTEVLDAMREIPRERFVNASLQRSAYADTPLPIDEGQTISQPYVVGLMLEAAALHPGDRVLEVGAGSGYLAAVASRIAAEVYAVERRPRLTELAGARLKALGYDNITLRTGDGAIGWLEAAPFDAILVSAGGPSVPQALKDQLDIGGRLVMPVGDDPRRQRLIKLERMSGATYREQDLGEVSFVPLIGDGAWPDHDARPPESKVFGRGE